ncbi:MAG: peptidylprolyl isomerase [OM182 bacterium MED-G24]|uniref:Peptidyl-prolyl cis-trans isomerase n=1 Tax=OM182 bacterium MED-G24 TaxID=1986255 RepID=A0A2A5WWF8_9GAMM|nr:MAG: peptidylprolyl isomerase [OM182 bacterium MED-G24]
MKIGPRKVVSFEYKLSDESGQEFEASDDESMKFLFGRGQILLGLEDALKGHSEGDEVIVTLPPERAYGLYDENNRHRISSKHVAGNIKRKKPGEIISVNTPSGVRNARLIKAGKFNVDIDSNHPLAGKTLRFEMTVKQVRDASQEELDHGHAH